MAIEEIAVVMELLGGIDTKVNIILIVLSVIIFVMAVWGLRRMLRGDDDG